MKCSGCGRPIEEADALFIIGKDPVEYCSKCFEFSSTVRPDPDGWKVTTMGKIEEVT